MLNYPTMRRTMATFLCLLAGAVSACAMDLARIEALVDAAVLQFGVQGRGVLVVIIDRGLDYANNDFRKPDGTTRITEMFDLTDNTGAKAANNPYGMGTIYTQAQINAALAAGGTALAEQDYEGHGTTTTGIAAGNGFNSRDWKYRGEAPKATLLIVNVVEGVNPLPPGVATPPGESSLFPIGLMYAQNKAKQLGMPAVVLYNSGAVGGPGDGSSSGAQLVNTVVGPGIPGIAFVTGTSDDGGMPNHAQTTVAQGQGVALNITQTGTVPFSLDLWYPTTDLYTVTIQTPTATYGPYAAPATNTTCSDTQKTADFSYFQCGASNSTWGPVTARQLEIDFTGNPGNYTITIQGTKASGGQFNAWLSTDETAVGASALGAAFTNLSRSGLYHVGRRGGIQ